MAMPTQLDAGQETNIRLQRKSLFAMGVGNVLEWFDWTIYTVASVYIAATYFQKGDPFSSLLQTLAVFAIGFVMRPLGGIVFGRLANRLGRRAVLISTMCLMAVGSLLIGVTPSFEAIGTFAPVLLVIARLIQGFGHGGETGTSLAYIAEIAPPERRGLWSSSTLVAIGTGSLLATLMMAAFGGLLSPEDMSSWGWRIPFVFGAALALFALFLRRGMMETSTEMEHSDAPRSSTVWTRAQVMQAGFNIFLIEAGSTVTYYTWVTSVSLYAIGVVGMKSADAFFVSAIAQFIWVVTAPLIGRLSDKIGRKTSLLISLVGIAVVIFPLYGMVTKDPWTLFVAELVGILLVSFLTGPKGAAMSEQIPSRYRTVIFGTGISLAVAVFGGTASYLTTWLYGIGFGWIFNLYVIALCIVASAAVLTWKNNTGIRLEDV